MMARKRKIWQVRALDINGKQVVAFERLPKREAREAAKRLRWMENIVHAYVERMPGR